MIYVLLVLMLSYFNSIKVRLKLSPQSSSTTSLIKSFQFHKGTIKTPSRYVQTRTEQNFNSIKVRLKLKDVEQRL